MASEAIAPHSSALFLMYSRSASSWPTLPQIAITSRFFSTCSHFRQHEVSRPPEYASTTFSFSAWLCLSHSAPRRRQFQINVFSVRRLCFDPDWMLRCTKTEPNRCGEATAGNKKPGRAGCCHASNCIATENKELPYKDSRQHTRSSQRVSSALASERSVGEVEEHRAAPFLGQFLTGDDCGLPRHSSTLECDSENIRGLR